MRSCDIKLNRLYDELVHLWPLISPPAAYGQEAQIWRQVLREKLGAGRHEILELGVGGGHNLSHLKDDFKATAVDLSEEMLTHSKRLNPSVEHHVGDMRSIRLARRFKAVLIHDAISYMLTESDLTAAFLTAAAHLEAGGVFITAPDFYRETFTSGHISHSTHTHRGGELALIEYSYDPDPTDTTIETILFYIVRDQSAIRIEHDRHITGLFRMQTWVDLIEKAGFRVEKKSYELGEDRRQRYLLVGVLEGGQRRSPQVAADPPGS